MSQKVYLGIDTSCYTTSAALLAEDGSLLAEARQILSVKPGRCGLQQSEMVFQHTPVSYTHLTLPTTSRV